MSETFLSGKHFIVDLWGVDFETADNEMLLSDLLYKMADIAQVHVMGESRHKFCPQGFTMLLLLSESHLSIHTYPERGYIAMDLYTCSDPNDSKNAIMHAIYELGAEKYSIREVARGIT